MRSAFPSFFGSDDATKAKHWDGCVFVFDTNVLTSLYKRSDEAREALFKIIQSLGDKVWIPNQVAYEFLRNRPSIAHEQSCMYSEASKKLADFIGELESNTKHPFLDDELHKSFASISCKVISALDNKARHYEAKLTSDDIKERLADLLAGKVGDPYSDNKLRDVIKDGESRYSNHMPPGYEDAGKHKGSTIFEHVRARFGDWILWRQILDYAKVSSTSIVMVTGDQKDDWWLRAGGKTLSPRPELMAEFKLETGCDFYMYSHSGFLSLANDYLDQRTSDSVIKEIEDAALEDEVYDDSLNVLPWDEVGGASVDKLDEQRRDLEQRLESSAKTITAKSRFLSLVAAPSLRRRIKAELNELHAQRESLKHNLHVCMSQMSALGGSDLDDLI